MDQGLLVKIECTTRKKVFLTFCKSRRSKNWGFQKLRNLDVFNLNNNNYNINKGNATKHYSDLLANNNFGYITLRWALKHLILKPALSINEGDICSSITDFSLENFIYYTYLKLSLKCSHTFAWNTVLGTDTL